MQTSQDRSELQKRDADQALRKKITEFGGLQQRRWQLSWIRKDTVGKQGRGILQAKSLLSRGNGMSTIWRWRVCSVRVQ